MGTGTIIKAEPSWVKYKFLGDRLCLPEGALRVSVECSLQNGPSIDLLETPVHPQPAGRHGRLHLCSAKHRLLLLVNLSDCHAPKAAAGPISSQN